MFGIALMELVVEEAEALGPDPEAFRGFYERALPRIYGSWGSETQSVRSSVIS
jgi:hypothetical protein